MKCLRELYVVLSILCMWKHTKSNYDMASYFVFPGSIYAYSFNLAMADISEFSKLKFNTIALKKLHYNT